MLRVRCEKYVNFLQSKRIWPKFANKFRKESYAFWCTGRDGASTGNKFANRMGAYKIWKGKRSCTWQSSKLIAKSPGHRNIKGAYRRKASMDLFSFHPFFSPLLPWTQDAIIITTVLYISKSRLGHTMSITARQRQATIYIQPCLVGWETATFTDHRSKGMTG